MRGSGLARPTRALLTTWSARSPRPSESRSDSSSRAALETSTSGTRTRARRSSETTSSSARNGDSSRARASSYATCGSATSPAREDAIASAHSWEVISPSSRGSTVSGANATFLVVPSAIPATRSSASRRAESKERITLSTSHRTAPKGGLLPSVPSLTRDRDLLVVVQLVHQGLDLRLVPDEVAAGGAGDRHVHRGAVTAADTLHRPEHRRQVPQAHVLVDGQGVQARAHRRVQLERVQDRRRRRDLVRQRGEELLLVLGALQVGGGEGVPGAD